MAISIRYPHQTPLVDASGLVNSLADLGDLYQSRRADDKAADAYGAWMQASGAPQGQQPMTLASLAPQGQVAPQMDPASARVASAHAASGGMPPQGAIEAYIRHAAQKRNIDPEIAVKVAMSEGGVTDPTRQSDVVKNGVREQSYGPFQLYMNGGLGNEALAAGIDPRKDWKGGIDFALDRAREGGWGPWYGAEKVGVTGMMGIGGQEAPQQVAQMGAPMPQGAPMDGGSLLPPPDVMKALLRSPSFKPMAIDMMRTAQAARQGDPEAALRLQKLQLEVENLRNPQAEEPKIVELFDEQTGQPYKARYNTQTGEYERVGGIKARSGMTLQTNPDGTVSLTQGSMGGAPKLNESEGRNAGFYGRGLKSHEILNNLEAEGTSLWNKTVGNTPVIGNYMRSEDAQRYDQAKRDFINAVLRRESGAVIADSEFANAEQQYFPQPGDGPEVIEQKRRNRETTLRGIEVSSGQGAALATQPPSGLSNRNRTSSGVQWSIDD